MSCEEDISQCHAAVDLGIPVVTSEFLLTGILQQKLDVDAYPLHSYFVITHTKRIPASCKSSNFLHVIYLFFIFGYCKCCKLKCILLFLSHIT